MSELEKPRRRIKACNGVVRKLVKRLPLDWHGLDMGNEAIGDRSMATGSPFSAPVITLNSLLMSLSIIRKSGVLVKGTKSIG